MASTPVLAALTVAPGRLAAAFREVPDPRRAASVVYPVAAVLALAAAALLANHRSVLASAEWGRAKTPPRWPRWGAPTGARRANRPCSACSAGSPATRWPRS